MLEHLLDIIKYESESAHVDFKQQEYPLGKHAKKNELLKDISAMANHPSNNPKYILIGIKEENGMAADFFEIEKVTDQAKYQQFIDENIEPKINFKYIQFKHEGKRLAVFEIASNDQRPYLFKKNVKRPTDQSLEFRIGDGFIRTGTSSRKLKRSDLEEIYTKRVEAKDRKSDLRINPIFLPVPRLQAYIIDFSIENISSRSIGFDAEMKISHEGGTRVKKKHDMEHGNTASELSSIYPQYFKPELDPTALDLEISKQDNHTTVVLNRRLHEEYSVRIPQKDKIKNIFLQEILVDFFTTGKSSHQLFIEVILRSDDFKSGPLIEKFALDLSYNT